MITWIRLVWDKSVHRMNEWSFFQLFFEFECDLFPFYLHPGNMVCPICHWEPVSVCGLLFSVSCWWLQMLAPSYATSPVLQRKPLPRSSASSSSMRPWRNLSTWGTTIPSTRTTTWTSSLHTRMWTLTTMCNSKSEKRGWLNKVHFLEVYCKSLTDKGLFGHPDVLVLPQMFMRWAFWPYQWHREVLGDEQCHCLRNLLGSPGGQGTPPYWLY